MLMIMIINCDLLVIKYKLFVRTKSNVNHLKNEQNKNKTKNTNKIRQTFRKVFRKIRNDIVGLLNANHRSATNKTRENEERKNKTSLKTREKTREKSWLNVVIRYRR